MAELLVTRHEHIAVLTLNRPEAGNRFTTSLATEVALTLEAARNDDSVRACVLTGAGDVFCLGGDYQGAGPTAAGRKAYAAALLRMDRAMGQLGKPLVAAVNGDAHAGGLQRRRRLRSRGRRRRSHVRVARGRARLVPVHRTRHRQGRAAEEGAVRSRLLGASHACRRSAVPAPRQRGRRRQPVLERAVERARARRRTAGRS